MESLVMSKDFWQNKSVFITGHSGFKGSWLSLWLSSLGSNVYGYSLEPNTNPNLYSILDIDKNITSSTFGDINNQVSLNKALKECNPEIIIHMAAQPLVRESYITPVETLNTNIIGTANVFDAARDIQNLKVILNVTTDKCYENLERIEPYKETEALGGYDPYSASKACSEIVTSAYRKSFFNDLNINIASARAGNVIGGGDWSQDRLIPDIINANRNKKNLHIRSPYATRPWQHVLEPLSGYMTLVESLYQDGNKYNESWNFGPDAKDVKSVAWVSNYCSKKLENLNWVDVSNKYSPHEAQLLQLDSTKAKTKLKWAPKWSVETALDHTISWYESLANSKDIKKISLNQIKLYQNS
jgi:CDP-glucose 4,6-dehydratase